MMPWAEVGGINAYRKEARRAALASAGNHELPWDSVHQMAQPLVVGKVLWFVCPSTAPLLVKQRITEERSRG